MIYLIVALLLFFPWPSTHAAEPGQWSYGNRGLEWNNHGGSYLWAGLRFQARYSNREDEPLASAQLREEGDQGYQINRLRYKIGAGLADQATFYHEYDLRNSRLLDLRGTWTPADRFNLRAGQWKVEFHRERIDSSGKQQFVERSIANYWFTTDRQNGVMASGRLLPGGAADSSWWLGIFNGNGLNEGGDGGRPMVVGRWQWNFTGGPVPFSQSSLKRYDPARGSLALGLVSNDSPYTRFSSSGGGQLPGYEEGRSNQYRVRQGLLELAWQYRGWSLQGEAHDKEILERADDNENSLRGGYLQTGWFPSARYPAWPRELEIAARYARVVPDRQISEHDNQELSLAVNWFFQGHRNKLTADLSYLEIEDEGGLENDLRVRLQWDVSI